MAPAGASPGDTEGSAVITMHLIGFLALMIGPTAFWVAYHLYKDRHQPEPPRFLLLAYGLGLAGGYLASLGYGGLEIFGLRLDAYSLAREGQFGQLLLYAVLAIGAIEELAKFLPFWLVGIRHHHFDEPIDGIIYASIVALGFATWENTAYLHVLTGWEALGRSVAAPMVHVLFASLWGYACGRAHARELPLWPGLLLGLGLAIAAHGLYDFLVIGFPHSAGIGAPLIIGAIWMWRIKLIQRLHLEHVRQRLVDRMRRLWVDRGPH